MSVFEALVIMISFATLVVAIIALVYSMTKKK